jgi:hypothetical protein
MATDVLHHHFQQVVAGEDISSAIASPDRGKISHALGLGVSVGSDPQTPDAFFMCSNKSFCLSERLAEEAALTRPIIAVSWWAEVVTKCASISASWA